MEKEEQKLKEKQNINRAKVHQSFEDTANYLKNYDSYQEVLKLTANFEQKNTDAKWIQGTS